MVSRLKFSRLIHPDDCPIKRCHCRDWAIDNYGFYDETNLCPYYDVIADKGRVFCYCPSGLKLELDLF